MSGIIKIDNIKRAIIVAKTAEDVIDSHPLLASPWLKDIRRPRS